MALYSMIIKAYPQSVVSITLRAIGSSASLNGIILATRQRINGSLHVHSHNFSSLTTAKDLVDTSIYKALKNQIKYAKSELKNQAIMPPESFPFKIEEDMDDPSSRLLTLTRKFLDEDILVHIDASKLNIEEEIESDDDFSSTDDSSEDDNDISYDKKGDGCESKSEKGSNEDDGGSKPKTDREVDYDDQAVAAAIPMTVIIDKAGGDKSLSFNITFSTEDIVIDSFVIFNCEKDDYGIKLEGPKFKKMNFELQRSLYKYLDIRGIKVNMARFLLKYIAQKKKKADLMALKYIKNVIKH